MQKNDKTLAKKKLQAEKTSFLSSSSHLHTAFFLDFRRVVFTTPLFLGGLKGVRQRQQWRLPPASSFSALPSSPDPPLRPTPRQRRFPTVAKEKEPRRRFSSKTPFREYACARAARTKWQTLKLQKNIWPLLTEEEKVFFPTLTADTTLKVAVVWLFDQGLMIGFDVVRQMALLLVTSLAIDTLMPRLLVWRGGLCALIL